MDGQIQLILVPMYSGKSSELLRRIRRFKIANYSTVVVKHGSDTRYGDDVITHSKDSSWIFTEFYFVLWFYRQVLLYFFDLREA